MNLYQELGPLILGTRLKRQSDYFLSEINKVYADKGISFEASWFGVFYLLSKFECLSILEISEKLEVSHSAISQLVKILEQKDLVEINSAPKDRRKKVVKLSQNGSLLLSEIKPIWHSINNTLEDILGKNPLLENLTKMEVIFSEKSLNERIKSCFTTEKTI